MWSVFPGCGHDASHPSLGRAMRIRLVPPVTRRGRSALPGSRLPSVGTVLRAHREKATAAAARDGIGASMHDSFVMERREAQFEHFGDEEEGFLMREGLGSLRRGLDAAPRAKDVDDMLDGLLPEAIAGRRAWRFSADALWNDPAFQLGGGNIWQRSLAPEWNVQSRLPDLRGAAGAQHGQESSVDIDDWGRHGQHSGIDVLGQRHSLLYAPLSNASELHSKYSSWEEVRAERPVVPQARRLPAPRLRSRLGTRHMPSSDPAWPVRHGALRSTAGRGRCLRARRPSTRTRSNACAGAKRSTNCATSIAPSTSFGGRGGSWRRKRCPARCWRRRIGLAGRCSATAGLST